MPLLINDLVYDSSKIFNFFEFYTLLKEISINQFRSKPIHLINSPKFLFISQGEYCIVNKNDDNIDYLGSDEATTCCLLFLENEHSIAVSHLDNSLKYDGLRKLVNELISATDKSDETKSNNKLNDIESDKLANKSINHKASTSSFEFNNDSINDNLFRLNCRLVGSYNDEQQSSIKFIYRLFNYLDKIPNVIINLSIACILDLNTKIINENGKKINYPIFYGAVLNLQTNLFTPAEFQNRGPEIIRRKVRHTCSNCDLTQVYNSNDKLFKIDEFKYIKIKYIDQLVNANDRFILDNFSTSPNVEPSHFADSTREVFRFILNNSQTKSIEPKTEFKRQSDGSWIRI